MNCLESDAVRMKLGVVWLLVGGVALASSPDVDFKDLSDEGKRVVKYLKEDWKKRFRSTTIPWAMKNLNIQPDDDLRLQVGQYFRDHPGLVRNLRFWGANNYFLSDQEKLIAKFLISTYEEDGRIPGMSETAEALGIHEEELKGRLNFMSRAGLLEPSESKELGYALIKRYNRWGGPLRHNFHTVHVEGDNPFGVW